jgi:hypothetical protein
MSATVTARFKRHELSGLMHQLLWDRCLRMNKYRLLDLVDKQNDAAGNWKLITDAFEDVGGDVDDLCYLYLNGDEILIMVGEPKSF